MATWLSFSTVAVSGKENPSESFLDLGALSSSLSVVWWSVSVVAGQGLFEETYKLEPIITTQVIVAELYASTESLQCFGVVLERTTFRAD